MEITAIAAFLAGFATFLGLMKVWVWPMLIKGWDKMLGQQKILDAIGEINGRLTFIEMELSPNTGKSMKDQQTKLYNSMLKIEGKFLELSEESRVKREHDNIPTIELNMKGDLIYANRAFLRLTDRTYFEVKNRGWINSLHGNSMTVIPEALDAAIADKRSMESKICFKNSQGTNTYCFIKAYIMGDKDNTIGYLAYITTI